MMREYRAKNVVTGKWVYGDLVTNRSEYNTYIEHIENNTHNLTVVDENTLGQYTGLCNKWDHKLYEGDIFDINGICYIEYDCDKAGYILYYPYKTKTINLNCDLIWKEKTIGNIHDNPGIAS